MLVGIARLLIKMIGYSSWNALLKGVSLHIRVCAQSSPRSLAELASCLPLRSVQL